MQKMKILSRVKFKESIPLRSRIEIPRDIPRNNVRIGKF